MAVDFSKIFATNGNVQAPTDEQYLQGFAFLGSAPPTEELFNYLLQNVDNKLKNLKDNKLDADALVGVNLWRANTAHTVGDVRYPITDSTRTKLLECTVAGTTAAVEPTWPVVGQTVTDGTVTWVIRDIRAGEQIGSIKPWLANAAPPGWLALDTGALVSRATYPQLWAWVQANAPLITDAAWQDQAAVQSSVGAYSSGDGSTTFRLPRIVDYLRGGLVADVGTWQGDAIRNITGSFGAINYSGSTGAFSQGDANGTGGSGSAARNINFSAATVVPTADENRPKTIRALYCVKAFDAPVNQGLIDITALANEVAGKVPLTDFIGANQSKTANGWQKLPGGLILQWQTSTITSINTALTTVTFPISFPNICIGVLATSCDSSTNTPAYKVTNTTKATTSLAHSGTAGASFLTFIVSIGY